MIRRMDNHPATIDQLRRRARLKAWAAEQWSGPVEHEEPEAPRADVLCVVCRQSHPFREHCVLTCAAKHGLNGGDLFVLKHQAAAPRCAGRCGAVVTSAGAVCISCVSAA
jgi:hypothetical protein